MSISVLIIDDELLARRRVTSLLKAFDDIEVIGECKTGTEAIEQIEMLAPDLIYLDINLKNMTGFDVLTKISTETPPLVIFITAYDEFALKAFDFFAFDYLLKPYNEDRFVSSTNRAIDMIKKGDLFSSEEKLRNLLNELNKDSINYKKQSLPIKLGNKVMFIKSNEIKYISASGYYAEIHTSEKKHLLRDSLKNLVNDLDSNSFIRIHRSTILNIHFVSELINSSFGELDVKMSDKKIFRVSKSYKKEFLRKMGI